MDFLSRRADDAISELLQQCEQQDGGSTLWNLQNHIKCLENELRCMRIFLECVNKRWGDLEDVLQVGSLVHKIEATLEETENKIIHLPPFERPPKHSLILNILKRKSLDRKLYKLHSDMKVPKDLKIQVMIEVGRVAITAALQFCWWCTDDPFKKIAGCNFLELQHKIGFTSPEFLHVNLKLLRNQNGDGIGDQANKFLMRLFPLEKDFAQYLHLEEPHTLHGELKSLVISVVTFPMEDAENVQRLFADVGRVLNMMAKEAASYHHAFSAA